MADDLPADWSVPTFREVAEPVTMLGLPPEMAMVPIMLGGGGAALLVIVSATFSSLPCFFAAIALAATSIPAGLFLLRHLYKIDPHFVEHLTTHRFHATRYLGK